MLESFHLLNTDDPMDGIEKEGSAEYQASFNRQVFQVSVYQQLRLPEQGSGTGGDPKVAVEE